MLVMRKNSIVQLASLISRFTLGLRVCPGSTVVYRCGRSRATQGCIRNAGDYASFSTRALSLRIPKFRNGVFCTKFDFAVDRRHRIGIILRNVSLSALCVAVHSA
jgi:hypothetical protein